MKYTKLIRRTIKCYVSSRRRKTNRRRTRWKRHDVGRRMKRLPNLPSSSRIRRRLLQIQLLLLLLSKKGSALLMINHCKTKLQK